jgi:hypothetical protein
VFLIGRNGVEGGYFIGKLADIVSFGGGEQDLH